MATALSAGQKTHFPPSRPKRMGFYERMQRGKEFSASETSAVPVADSSPKICDIRK
jgi:hypothetical protein